MLMGHSQTKRRSCTFCWNGPAFLPSLHSTFGSASPGSAGPPRKQGGRSRGRAAGASVRYAACSRMSDQIVFESRHCPLSAPYRSVCLCRFRKELLHGFCGPLFWWEDNQEKVSESTVVPQNPQRISSQSPYPGDTNI